MNSLSTVLIIGGVVLIVFGLAFAGKLGPLGRLPGDVVIEWGNFSLYIPLMTSIIISAILAMLFRLFGK